MNPNAEAALKALNEAAEYFDEIPIKLTVLHAGAVRPSAKETLIIINRFLKQHPNHHVETLFTKWKSSKPTVWDIGMLVSDTQRDI